MSYTCDYEIRSHGDKTSSEMKGKNFGDLETFSGSSNSLIIIFPPCNQIGIRCVAFFKFETRLGLASIGRFIISAEEEDSIYMHDVH